MPDQAATETKRQNVAMGPIIAIVALVAALTASVALAYVQAKFSPGYVEIGDGLKVTVTVAANDATREKGLSGHDPLRPDEGMLFIFDRADTYAFWMKDMTFPIDILWITNGVLADITTDAAIPVPGQELPLYFPKVPVDRVLEVNAGYAKLHGLRTGMPVKTVLTRGNK